MKCWISVGGMLDESLYYFYESSDIFIHVSSDIFIQHESPLVLSFNVKSKMAADMLLLVILSELRDSDDEKSRRGKTREQIKQTHQLGSLQNITKGSHCGGLIPIFVSFPIVFL